MACRGLYLKIQKSCSVSGNTVVGHLLCQIIKVWCHGLRSEVFSYELGSVVGAVDHAEHLRCVNEPFDICPENKVDSALTALVFVYISYKSGSFSCSFVFSSVACVRLCPLCPLI